MPQDPRTLWARHPNPLVRLAGTHRPAARVLDTVLRAGQVPVHGWPDGQIGAEENVSQDYAQVDPVLHMEASGVGGANGSSQPGLGYAGLLPEERWRFFEWLREPSSHADRALRRLYLMHLETGLLEEAEDASPAWDEITRLLEAPGWQGDAGLSRVALLGAWLAQEGGRVATVVAGGGLSARDLGIALGWQAVLQEPLAPVEVPVLARAWRVEDPTTPGQPLQRLDQEALVLRLTSLKTALGQEVLAYALACLPEGAWELLPWRCLHRDLRIAIPQSDLRPVLEPLLAELHSVVTPVQAEVADDAPDGGLDPTGALGWHLILEFGNSTSQFFEIALHKAQRLPGYQQLLDENRRMVYRIIFQKRELRSFWQIWDYVQNWSQTRVYVNGEEMEKWKVAPYSPFLR